MLVIVAYDVNTMDKPGRKRLRKIAQACKNYGKRVQRSVFECIVNKDQWVMLRAALLKIINKDEDSLRIYFLDEEAKSKIEHHGIAKPLDLEEPLLI
jgi:CRISPR-associated protein Cas2